MNGGLWCFGGYKNEKNDFIEFPYFWDGHEGMIQHDRREREVSRGERREGRGKGERGD